MNIVSHPSSPARFASLSDAELFAEVQSGEADAFCTLVRRYQAGMYRVALSRLHRDDWAEEALQETWLAAFRSAHTYNPRYALRTWLWTILLNECRRLSRRRMAGWTTAEGESACQSLVEEPVGSEPTPLGSAIANERRRLLDRLLNRLPENESDALRLRFFGGMTFAEIAETTGCSLLTAKNRVRRGLMRLSEMQQIRSLGNQTIHELGGNESRDQSVQHSAAAVGPARTVSPEGSGDKS